MKTLQLLLLIPLWGYSQNATLKSPDELFPVIHWNSQSAVKNQGAKNTCSAFGVAAALETFNGVPNDLSEKYLYAIQKVNDRLANKKTTDGQFLISYPNALITDGVITESELPYNPEALKNWYKTDNELSKALEGAGIGFMKLLMEYRPKAKIFLNGYEYLDRIPCKNTEYLKSLLKNGVKAIPVSYEVYLPAWKKYRSIQLNTITPDPGYSVITKTGQYMPFSAMTKIYPTGFAEKLIAGEFNIVRNDQTPNQYFGHVVTIIGYDDQGFIIKNSWGPDWRMNGYERVSYDFHKLFAYEALIIKSLTIKNY